MQTHQLDKEEKQNDILKLIRFFPTMCSKTERFNFYDQFEYHGPLESASWKIFNLKVNVYLLSRRIFFWPILESTVHRNDWKIAYIWL